MIEVLKDWKKQSVRAKRGGDYVRCNMGDKAREREKKKQMMYTEAKEKKKPPEPKARTKIE